MTKACKGSFTTHHGKQFYKIENFDAMEDFFMTITSASDIWNFCWSQGGITAGRIDCDHAVFPYYTADKVSDAKSYTGSYTAIRVEKDGMTRLWEPFAPLYSSPAARNELSQHITRNIYKNIAGTTIYFEEQNDELGLSFEYGWTSSAKFGLVRTARIQNLSAKPQTVTMLDGCRNILPACVSADFQNGNSVLLDAYKKTDLDGESNLALFSVSSIVTDKAEPSEGLYANTCWFTTEDRLSLSPDAASCFANGTTLPKDEVIKGKRPSCFICRNVSLKAAGEEDGTADSWYQVFDTQLDACRIALLKNKITNRSEACRELQEDIASGESLMEQYVAAADGIQQTADKTSCTHHFENVMFNIMRGGFFANGGKIDTADFLLFISQRNKSYVEKANGIVRAALAKKGTLLDAKEKTHGSNSNGANATYMSYEELRSAIVAADDAQLKRLFLEYLPLTFSRRHGDPSRPWNRFNIKLRDSEGNPILNYEGNWRDIFQNWEALSYSYPQYVENMCTVFLNAMTADGFNPYHLSRNGIDWEIPDPDNPWAQIGYWGDHQVIYLQKLLEWYSRTNRKSLVASLGKKQYASANVPYRLKSYAEIVQNPRSTITFDRTLSTELQKEAASKGGDAKLLSGKDGNPQLVSLTTKLLQIVISKAANFVPAGGIWLNTQRPEWNDANNALAGYGLSLVTLCYLHRYISFLISLYAEVPEASFPLPQEVADCFIKLGELYGSSSKQEVATDDRARRTFTTKAGILFEIERNSLYAHGYSTNEQQLTSKKIIDVLSSIQEQIAYTITLNKREDGLYHAYNTMKVTADSFEVDHLQEMLEGQVAVLSAGMLSPQEALSVITALKNSRMFESRQYSYLLYPNKELPPFIKKNCVSQAETAPLAPLLSRTGTKLLAKDCTGVYHFNADFRNVRIMEEYLLTLPQEERPSAQEDRELRALYEKTFSHQSFTGRSGTFYAYEGLGSIYWHMVSKLLLAVQENVFTAARLAKEGSCPQQIVTQLAEAYYDVRKGIGFNKEPSVYGAFPCDPYSHTPSGQGAKQPGMTGQVKEEILTRWGELGVTVSEGTASFNPVLLQQKEFLADGTLSFTWCGIPVTYHLANKDNLATKDGIELTESSGSTQKRSGTSLTAAESAELFSRSGTISAIDVWVSPETVGSLLSASKEHERSSKK